MRAILLTLTLAAPVVAQDFQPLNLAGTVVAGNKTGLSYQTGGCITGLAQGAIDTGLATKGQVLVQLDDRAANLALATAQARLADSRAAVQQADFAITSATADIARITEELAFADKEFERTKVLFRRGLINETALETVERRKLDATFAVDRAGEALQRADTAKARADIALDVAMLDVRARELDLEALSVTAPFDGVLLNFDPSVGDCVQAGGQAAQIYAPGDKSVETFVVVDQLVDGTNGVAIGKPVSVMRVNGAACAGAFSWIGSEANLETQNVKTKIDLDPGCAPDLFLNEAVEIETLPPGG